MIKKILKFYFNCIYFFFKKSENYPKISIVIAFHNDKKFIQQTLKSVAQQSYKNFECILVDDCSTDGTREIVDRFVSKNSKFKILSHEANKGLSAARNTGLAAAQGAYISFLDADDILFVHSLWFRICKLIEEDAESLIGTFGGCIYFPEEGLGFKDKLKTCFPLLQQRLVYYPIWNGEYPFVVHSPILKTNIVKKLGGFDESYTKGVEDYEFWSRCLKNGYFFERSSYFVCAYRQKQKSMLKDALVDHSQIFKHLLGNAHLNADHKNMKANTIFHFIEDYEFYSEQFVLAQRILKLLYFKFSLSQEIDIKLLNLLDKKVLKTYLDVLFRLDLYGQTSKLLPSSKMKLPSSTEFRAQLISYLQ